MKIQIPSFQTKQEKFNWLVKNKADIIDLKKSETKKADAFSGFSVTPGGAIVKAEINPNDTEDAIQRTIVGNTYLWMDSHDDVHLNNVFSKSIQERANKIWHLHDHLYQLAAKVGVPKTVYETYVDWTRLGVNKAGQTQILAMDSLIQKEMNAAIFKGYKNGDIQQHSVGMRYVQMALAINDPDYKAEFAAWNAYIDLIGNKAAAEEQGYFWPIMEAKLIEISCVLEGSNELTPAWDLGKLNTETQPDKTTVEQPPMPTKFNVLEAIGNTKFINI